MMNLALPRRITGALLFAVAGLTVSSGAARAADTKAVAAQIAAHNKSFLAAYEKGATAKMKVEIGKSLALGAKNGLADKPDARALMADTYVLAAILEVDGNENRAAGVRDFVKALKLAPDVALPQGTATSPVKAALKEAKAQTGGAPKEAAAAASVPKTTVTAKDEAKKADDAPAKAEAEAKRDDKKSDETKDETKEQTKDQSKKAEAEKQAAADKEAEAEKQAAEKQAVAKAKADEKKADAEKLAAEKKADVEAKQRELPDRQTREAKAEHDKRIAQLEKDKADRDKQLADAKTRAAQLEADKADRDKKISELNTRVQQLERQRDEREKLLAEARAVGAKERDAREKIERDRAAAAAKVQAAEDQRKRDQQERERLLAGPELPARLPEALHCAIPDEAPARADLYVHCAARAGVKARTIVFYYRVGGAHYTSVTLDRTPKGWYAAVIPGARLVGKSLQYYAQAFDAREGVAATNGKESSPNILMLRGAPRG